MEDKYIFDVAQLHFFASKVGFAGLDVEKNGDVIWGYKPYVANSLVMIGIPRWKVQKFEFIFQSFGQTLSDFIGDQLMTPMAYLVFKK